MPFETNAHTLDQCVEALIDYRGKTPRKVDSGIPLITAKVVKAGRIAPPTEFIAVEDFDAWMTRGLPQVGDVVMTTEAPLGEVGRIERLPVALAQRVVTLRGKTGLLHNDYLLYLLQSAAVQAQLLGRASGTTVVGIKQSELRKVTLHLPPLWHQIEVAAAMRTIDDQIDLLRQTNATFDAIAQAIFKSWFIDFDPVHAKAKGLAPEGMDEATAALFPNAFEASALGAIPRGWRHRRIDEFVELAYGKALKASDRVDGDVPVYGSGGITGTHNNKLVDGPGIIVGRKGTVGTVYWESGSFFAIDTVFFVKSEKPLTFIYYLFKTLGLEEMNTDAAVPGLNRNNVYRLTFALAPETSIAAFDDVVSPIRASIDANLDEIKTLAELRDTLLPRLISGKLRIPEAKALIEEFVGEPAA